MRNILLLISMLGLLPAGCGRTVSDTDTVSCDTFVYSVKGGDSLRLDRYTDTPAAEIDAKKPCMIFVFGGAFISGTRDAESYRPFFEYMAREQGYTVVSIDYRLGLKEPLAAGKLSPETFPQLLPQTVLMAVEDLYDATSFVAGKSAEWGIDPARIVACGSSAGAITVLQGAYFIANENPLTAKLPDGFDYAGVISFAGAVVDMADDLTWKRAPAPIMLFHGDADSNVPYGALRMGGAGIFGSDYIARQLSDMKSPYYFYSVEGADHALATVPMNNYRDAIDQFLTQQVGERLPAMMTRRSVSPMPRPAARHSPQRTTFAAISRANNRRRKGSVFNETPPTERFGRGCLSKTFAPTFPRNNGRNRGSSRYRAGTDPIRNSRWASGSRPATNRSPAK